MSVMYIYFRKDLIDLLILPTLSSRDVAVARMSNNTVICSLYRPSGSNTSFMADVLRKLCPWPYTLVAGDINAHNNLWGSYGAQLDSCLGGRNIADLIN